MQDMYGRTPCYHLQRSIRVITLMFAVLDGHAVVEVPSERDNRVQQDTGISFYDDWPWKTRWTLEHCLRPSPAISGYTDLGQVLP